MNKGVESQVLTMEIGGDEEQLHDLHTWVDQLQFELHSNRSRNRHLNQALQAKDVTRDVRGKGKDFIDEVPEPLTLITQARKHKPWVTCFPYLEEIIDAFEKFPPTPRQPHTFSADNLRYFLLKDLHHLGLYSPFRSGHRLYKAIDWIIDPPLYLYGPELSKYRGPDLCPDTPFDFKVQFDIWDDLSFHGDHTLSRHSMAMFDRFAPFWKDRKVAIFVGSKITHHAIHNADYKEAENLCQALRASIKETELEQ